MVLSLIIISSTSVNYVKVIESQNKAYVPAPEKQEVPDVLKAGQVGEVKAAGNGSGDTGSTGSNQLPPIVFNASGTITDIKSDRLIVKGDGSNFEDGVSRTLNVIFTPQATTFVSQDQKTKYQGLEGLNHLKVGDELLIDAAENIRGKAEFKVGTINLVK